MSDSAGGRRSNLDLPGAIAVALGGTFLIYLALVIIRGML